MTISQQWINDTVRRNKVFVLNKEKKIEDGCKLVWMLNSFLKTQHRKQRVKNKELKKILPRVKTGYLKSGPPA